MKDKYKDWIFEHVPTFEAAYGNCQVVCAEMVKEFPELTMVRGWYTDLGLPAGKEKRTHWWLITEEGGIIDPTAQQFHIPHIRMNYEEFIEGKHKVPTGKCMNCGELCYDGRTDSCTDKCYRELVKYYNS